MKSKKIFCLFLCLSILLSITACSNAEDPLSSNSSIPSNSTTPSTKDTSSDEDYKDVEIIACVEDDEKKREELKATRDIVCSTESLEYWLEKGVDIVAIGDKYGKRGPAVIKALKSGAHVIADKPICTTLKQFKEIKALSEKNNLKVACMLDLRYFSVWCSSGAVSEIQLQFQCLLLRFLFRIFRCGLRSDCQP